jgi:F-type H+-transporting ATPase subunit b
MTTLSRSLLLCTVLFSLTSVSLPAFAQAQDQPSSTSSSSEQKSAEPAQTQAEPEPKSFGGKLAKEEREATGAEEEENANLKHSSSVKWVARKTGISVHGAHLLAMVVDFILVAYMIFLILRYGIPGMLPAAFGVLRRRGESIQRALEEARAASQEANRRLAEIESRLRQLDVEIGQIQAHAEKESDAEEGRIKSAAEDDIRKVVEAAEQEIAAAAKLARRELTSHTADLAIALARQQIHVDANTDQALVHSFASKLSQNGGKDGN